VFLLGGGPSLSLVDVALLKDKPTIAVNTAGELAPWALLFFRDLRFYWGNLSLVDRWPGLVVSTCRGLGTPPARARVVKTTHNPEFPGVGSPAIRYGRSGGHLAVSLAIAMAALRIVLLGYDCKCVDGRSHWHDAYSAPSEWVYERDFLPAWEGWGEATARAGVEVVNATPGSAIREFPCCRLEELI
jgi:hypothetical protein